MIDIMMTGVDVDSAGAEVKVPEKKDGEVYQAGVKAPDERAKEHDEKMKEHKA